MLASMLDSMSSFIEAADDIICLDYYRILMLREQIDVNYNDKKVKLQDELNKLFVEHNLLFEKNWAMIIFKQEIIAHVKDEETRINCRKVEQYVQMKQYLQHRRDQKVLHKRNKRVLHIMKLAKRTP
jgi:hypothetical protein